MAIAEILTRVPEPTCEPRSPAAEAASEVESPRRRLFTRSEYYKCAELGIFDPDERLELIEGEILRKMSPQNEPHFRSVMKAAHVLGEAFGSAFHVRQQGPMRLSNDSEPEPDLVVVAGQIDEWSRHPQPSEGVLVVETSDSTLRFDIRRKAALYARAGVVEYWVVSLPERCLYVHRGPQATGEYAEVTKLLETESIAPLGAPSSMVEVSNLLPRSAAAEPGNSGSA